jgi:hypothetical protein
MVSPKKKIATSKQESRIDKSSLESLSLLPLTGWKLVLVWSLVFGAWNLVSGQWHG